MMRPQNEPLRVLLAGVSWPAGTPERFAELAREEGRAAECGLFRLGTGTLRALAKSLAEGTPGELILCTAAGTEKRDATLAETLRRAPWDAVVLEQPGVYAGFSGSCNGDLSCLIDAVCDLAPGAALWWNVSPADGAEDEALRLYYDGSEALLCNAAADLLAKNIIGEHARFGRFFAGWVPTGPVLRALGGPEGEERALAGALCLWRALLPDTPPRYLDAAGERVWSAAAAVDLERGPIRLPVPAPRRVEEECRGAFTVARAAAPVKLHFPDVAVLADGTVLAAVYAAVGHKTDPEPQSPAYCAEGSASIMVWDSRDGGKTWRTERPLLVIDEEWLERQGLVRVSGRYGTLKADPGADYVIAADPRDPNFGVVHADVTGAGERREVLLLTVFLRRLYPWGRDVSLWLIHSTDGGRTWGRAQELRRSDGGETMKRGDLAAFADGEVLVPYYGDGAAGVLSVRWDPAAGAWRREGDFAIPNTARDKTDAINEVSLLIPRPEEDTVFAFVRESGAVLRSDDRARSWREIGREPGLIHQPGFAPLDESSAFVTWAGVTSPRTCYGKVFYPYGDWTDTRTRTVYASPERRVHDMGDPSCKKLADGRVLAVCYDAAYRAIVGTILDPQSPEFLPVELDGSADTSALDWVGFDPMTPLEEGENVRLPDALACTVTARVRLPDDGQICFELGGAGRVAPPLPEDLPRDRLTDISAAVVGGAVWIRMEKGPWLRQKPRPGTGAARVSGRGELLSLSVTRRVDVALPDELLGFAGLSELIPEHAVSPRQKEVWSSDGDAVRTDPDGVVHFLRPGEATLTLTVGETGYRRRASAACRAVSLPVPAEITGAGASRLLFRDDFSGYPAGPGQFAAHAGEHGWTGRESLPGAGDEIVRRDGEQFLLLHASRSHFTWYRIDRPTAGDLTLRFDFYFTDPRPSPYNAAPGQYLYIDLWQDGDTVGFVHLTPEGLRAEYLPAGGTAARQEPPAFAPEVRWPLNTWHSARIARVRGGVFARVWPRGGAEPEGWDLILARRELEADGPACVRLQYYSSGSRVRYLALANVTLTQQET